MNERAPRKPRKDLHCAIYTRKSHEEGLDQDFNSLEAQREACEAYVSSQRGQGWKAVKTRYDDGGFSGGTMERPALRKLLNEVEAGRIDVIVVYKVDRLTRSLSDFAKMVDVFDARGISFVSVTQQFNTTTSMGRLTLNVLLSFAQFEREVTGERIRDKIAASKKKGIWMGGLPPLGYDSGGRKLVVNLKEAKTVRFIFRRYVEFGSVRQLKEVLDNRGIVSKIRESGKGKRRGGNPIAPGALYKILNNPIYIGEISHKGNRYPGEHEAIVDKVLWEKVQAMLAAGRVTRRNGDASTHMSLLAGLLYDERGDRMSPSHAVKKGRRYRYYVSRSLLTKTRSAGGRRLPAGEIEGIVIERLQGFFASRAEVFDAIATYVPEAQKQKRLLDRAQALSRNLLQLAGSKIRCLLLTLITRIEVHPEKVDIHLLPGRIPVILEDSAEKLPPAREASPKEARLILSVPAQLKRRGIEMKMFIDGNGLFGESFNPDPALVKLIVKAHSIKANLVNGNGMSLRQTAKRERMEGSYLTRLIRLTFLAPDITKAILEGRHPPELTAARLMRNSRLPLDWREQRAVLGFV